MSPFFWQKNHSTSKLSRPIFRCGKLETVLIPTNTPGRQIRATWGHTYSSVMYTNAFAFVYRDGEKWMRNNMVLSCSPLRGTTSYVTSNTREFPVSRTHCSRAYACLWYIFNGAWLLSPALGSSIASWISRASNGRHCWRILHVLSIRKILLVKG